MANSNEYGGIVIRLLQTITRLERVCIIQLYKNGFITKCNTECECHNSRHVFETATRFTELEKYIYFNSPRLPILNQEAEFWLFHIAPSIVYPLRMLYNKPLHMCVICHFMERSSKSMERHYFRKHPDKIPALVENNKVHVSPDNSDSDSEIHLRIWANNQETISFHFDYNKQNYNLKLIWFLLFAKIRLKW